MTTAFSDPVVPSARARALQAHHAQRRAEEREQAREDFRRLIHRLAEEGSYTLDPDRDGDVYARGLEVWELTDRDVDEVLRRIELRKAKQAEVDNLRGELHAFPDHAPLEQKREELRQELKGVTARLEAEIDTIDSQLQPIYQARGEVNRAERRVRDLGEGFKGLIAPPEDD